MPMPPLWGFTIFCDDIRAEVDGKVSFIGSYNGLMYVPSFPVTVPKFGFGVTIFEEKLRAIHRQTNLTLKVFLPGDPVDAATINQELSAEQIRINSITPDPANVEG